MKPTLRLLVGDALEQLATLPDESVHCCVTSPPYLDARPEYPSPTLDEFKQIFEELRRVVTGVSLVNVGRLWRGRIEQLWWVDLLAAARRGRWQLLDTLVWIKPNANPIHGEVFANSHEYVLVLGSAGAALNTDAIRRPHADTTIARFDRAWMNHLGVKNPRESHARKTRAEPNPLGARPRSYVDVNVGQEKGNPHPAPMPIDLAEHLVLLASWPGQTVLDPFLGSGTTAAVALALGRNCIGVELNPEYAELAEKRAHQWDRKRARLAQTALEGEF